jgi:hypothetical protein
MSAEGDGLFLGRLAAAGSLQSLGLNQRDVKSAQRAVLGGLAVFADGVVRITEAGLAAAGPDRTPWDVRCPACGVGPGSECYSVVKGRRALTHRARWHAIGVAQPTADDLLTNRRPYRWRTQE